MAPTVVVARTPKSKSKGSSSKAGFKVTSVSIMKTQPVMLWYSWTYERNSPDEFAVAVIKVGTDDIIVLQKDQFALGEGPTGKLSTNVVITSLKDAPGKYELALVNNNDFKEVYAKSKPIQIKKSDF
ncbi:hypothetical protein FRC04_011207 [Tulasnella sp. 424]|nr:hypothetical protein FRC04_011207 [Tulasnella sp. 424]KAG8971741.1 hypothetical protein FRC05_010808 [Tulasnella sp. 425]